MAFGQLQNCIDKNRDLEGEQVRLEVGNKQAATTFQQFADHIQKDRKVIVGILILRKSEHFLGVA